MTKRIAVIGAGGMGRFHASSLQGIPGVELGAVCDVVPDVAERAAADFAVPARTDPEGVAAEGWAGVVIASPDETHATLTLAALEAGSRVLCEKPLSHDLDGARAVVDRELGDGYRRVQLGFMREYDPAHTALATELASLGDLHYLRCTHRNTNAGARPPKTVLVQSLIHDIHTIHWLAGEVVDVDTRAIPRPGGLLHMLLVLRLESGATATVEFSDDTYAYEVEVEATAERGMVMTSPPQRPRLRIDGSHRSPIGDDWFGWFAAAYRIQDRAWVASLDDAAASGPSAWDGLAAQLVAEAGLASLASGARAEVHNETRPALYAGGPTR
jgi:myo-inositol 2-dehydrogenase/D-chiro-inositol 1-dehydrogenase